MSRKILNNSVFKFHSVFFSCLILFTASTAIVFSSLSHTHAQEAQGGKRAPTVVVSKASLRAIGRQAEFIGRVKADEKVEFRSRIQGFLRKVGFKDGDRIKKGQVIFEIEREPFEATLAQRNASLASAQATLNRAKLDLVRKKELVRKKTLSQASLDDSIAAEASALAAIQQVEAEKQAAEIQLSYTEIRSPIDGRIGRSVYTEGNLIGPDSGILATAVKADPAKVLFEVTQTTLLEARKNMGNRPIEVSLKLADGKIYQHVGQINFFDVVVNSQTDGQLVQAVFPNPDDALVENQSIRVVIKEAAPKEVLSIPIVALSTDQSGTFVLTVNDKEEVERNYISVGLAREGAIQVTGGLKEGDRVIVLGQLRVRPGIKVIAKSEPDDKS